MLSNENQYKHALIYGGIFGGTIFLLLILGFILGSANNANLQLFATIIFITGVIISTRKYRDIQPDKVLPYGKAFGTAFLTNVVIGFIWAIYGYILYKSSPGLLEDKLYEVQEAYLRLGWNEEKVAETVEQSSAIDIALSYFFSAVIYGGVLSLIVGAIFYRKPNPLMDQNEDN